MLKLLFFHFTHEGTCKKKLTSVHSQMDLSPMSFCIIHIKQLLDKGSPSRGTLIPILTDIFNHWTILETRISSSALGIL